MSEVKVINETKFTPGPWIHDKTFHLYVPDEYSQIIAGSGYVDKEDESIRGFTLSAIISDADAKLIAASPDLLEVLLECEDYFDNIADADHDENGYIPNKEMKLLATIQNAIKKATGVNDLSVF